MGANNQYIIELVGNNPELRAISSHAMRLPPPNINGVELLVLIMIRNPIRRILSVYDFERRQQAATPGALTAQRTTLREYVTWRMKNESGATIRDYFVRFLTRNSGLPTRIGSEHLEFALDFIRGNHLTGLVEEFDKSAVLFEEYFDRINITVDFSHIKQNVGSRPETSSFADLRTIRRELGESLWGEVLEKNSRDIELYRVAKELVDTRFSRIVDKDKRLKNLRARNRGLTMAGSDSTSNHAAVSP